MPRDAHAEMLAAAETARLACQAKVAQGFPGVLVKVSRPKGQPRKVKNQMSLLDSDTPRSDDLHPATPKEKVEPQLTLIQQALRAPRRPCPDLDRQHRIPEAHREVVIVDERRFVVRTQVQNSNIYCLFFDSRRLLAPGIEAVIRQVCPEAVGASTRGCIVVNEQGPTSGDEIFIERWLSTEEERDAVVSCANPRAWRMRS